MTTPHPLSAAELFDLKGWVAVVTGAGTGIGLIIAQTLAANGAKVYITGRRKEVLEKSARIHGSAERLGSSGGSIVPLVMDVTSKESIKAVVDEISSKETHINVLVNNAGVFAARPEYLPDDGPEKYSEALFAVDIADVWQNLYMTHCVAIYYVTAAFIPLLSKAAASAPRALGNVINVLSKDALQKTTGNGNYPYGVSKAAGLHLTKTMAYELQKDSLNIRVNAIAPGPTPSSMTGQGKVDDENMGFVSDEILQFIREYCAVTTKRWNTPQDISSAVLTLATNGQVYGTVIPIESGELLRHPSVV
ncbi:hypothetical protein F4810DRAFT_711349 [Camillea tinctor]|nr:hypothetical protein F4810DRAFT_711349 [Camillea tinctor]